MTDLFDPISLGAIDCRNRIAMAPCTRCMSPDFRPTDEVAAYYERRAADGLGLIISEGTVVCHRGAGHLDVPGIFAADQVEAWRRVTERVHDAGGRIVCQLWHVGAVAHPRTTGGALPEGPSGLSPQGEMSRLRDENGRPVPFGPSEAMSHERIRESIDEFRRAAEYAMEAGFDGVEIHGAHGYLLDQFTNPTWNRRDDEWGGQNRMRFPAGVARAVVDAIGADRVLYRLSPRMSVAREPWIEPESTFDLLLDALWEAGVRILHASNLQYDDPVLHVDGEHLPLHRACRRRWEGQLVGVGDLDPERARRAVADGEVDVVAFGRALIANSDLTSRIREGRALRPYDPSLLETLI